MISAIRMSFKRGAHWLVASAMLLGAWVPALGQSIYEKDVAFALEELPRRCGHFFKLKGIDWAAVSQQFTREARSIRTDQEHLVLLARLVARLRDGHATVRPLEKGKNVAWPQEPPRTGPGMFWCRIGEGIYVKNSWVSGAKAGIKPGMEVLKVDGIPAKTWLDQRIAERSDRMGFSTDQEALFSALHWGLAMPVGTELKLEVRDVDGALIGLTAPCQRANFVPWGPAFFPPATTAGADVRWARLKSGFGYIHLRRTPSNLSELVDKPLAELAQVPGLILDFRANGGGGFDHDEFMGRFIPADKGIQFNKRYRSSGPNPYAGPIVVIVDGNTRSAGETASGIFKEDGRAYMIGESRTAGMSSGKQSIDLPSGLFSLYVSVRTNMGRFNSGRGIEGIGVEPHEIVQYDPKDLASGIDTLTRRAEELLKNYPQDRVPYKPQDFGWAQPPRE